jgi:23S rRNA (adenine2503-C2)-methyltransferase
MEKISLIGLNLKEIAQETAFLGLPSYTSREIALWIYNKGATSFNDMSNISIKARKDLSAKFDIRLFPPSKVSISIDGTKKYLFPAAGSKYIETAYMPEKMRHTLCISSQVGCKMGCLFCMTARQGFQGHLKCSEILNQIYSLPERKEITNLVYMGMGEPFDNIDEVLKSLEILTSDYGPGFNPKKITVSTIGLIPGMKRFIEETKCQLAISLHSPFDEERAMLMPVENIYPVRKVIDFLKSYDLSKQRRISFEYILFKGINDSKAHINQLARLLNGLRCHINLMHFHPIPGTPLIGTTDQELQEFKNNLNKKGILTTIRASRGLDILAACGMLSTKENLKSIKGVL